MNNMKFVFFDDIEDNIVFSYIFDEDGVFVPFKTPKYNLFYGMRYPFTEYEEEMKALNQYCYEVAQIVKIRYNSSLDDLEKYKNLDSYYFWGKEFTQYEMVMSCKHEIYLWENIVWHSVCHIVSLLYSFLERALKRLWIDVFKPNAIEENKHKKGIAKIYYYIECIFNMSIDDFSEEYCELYNQLEIIRKYRNEYIHGNFEYNDINNDYEEIKIFPPFKLIEFLNTITKVLDMVEWQYSIIEDY